MGVSVGSGRSSPGASSQKKVYRDGPSGQGFSGDDLQECAAQGSGSCSFAMCRHTPPATLHGQGQAAGACPRCRICAKGSQAGAHRYPLCSRSCSTILIPRKGWHMLLNLCFHIAMTAAVFAGGITLTGYRAVCQAVGTGQRPAPRDGPWGGTAPPPCSTPSPTAASSRRSASSCTTRPSPRCSGWR